MRAVRGDPELLAAYDRLIAAQTRQAIPLATQLTPVSNVELQLVKNSLPNAGQNPQAALDLLDQIEREALATARLAEGYSRFQTDGGSATRGGINAAGRTWAEEQDFIRGQVASEYQGEQAQRRSREAEAARFPQSLDQMRRWKDSSGRNVGRQFQQVYDLVKLKGYDPKTGGLNLEVLQDATNIIGPTLAAQAARESQAAQAASGARRK